MSTSLIINVPGEYISLGLVLQAALEQASKGKGKERHAEADEMFENQIICEVARRTGTGFCLGQAVKKIYESQRLIPQLGVQELLGGINYLAAAVIVMQERMDEEGRKFREGFARSKAEGCEELVHDAPQTPEETCQRVKDKRKEALLEMRKILLESSPFHAEFETAGEEQVNG